MNRNCLAFLYAKSRSIVLLLPGCLVWGTMTGMTYLLLWHLFYLDIPYPYGDEYMLQEVLTGHTPLSWAWLWEPVYVHRATLVRGFMYAWTMLTDMNLKAAAWGTASLYIGTAVFMLYTIRNVRGYYRITDMVLPLIMVCCLQLPNIIAFLQLQFIIPYVFCMVFFCYCWKHPPGTTSRQLPFIAVCAIFLAPHCSAYGLCVGAGCFCWLVWYLAIPCGLLQTRKGRWIVAGIVVTGGIYLAVTVPWELVFWHSTFSANDLHQKRYGTPLTTLGRLNNGLTFLGLWAGVTVARYSATFWGLAEVFGLGWLVWVLGRQYRNDSTVRFKVSAVFTLLITTLLAAAMILVGKDSGWFPRYFTLITPLVCGVYAAFELLPAQRMACWARGIALCCLLIFSLGIYQDGVNVWRERQWVYHDWMAWSRAGKDPELLTPKKFLGLKWLIFPNVQEYSTAIERVYSAHLAVFSKLDILFSFANRFPLSGWQGIESGTFCKRIGLHDEAMMIVPCMLPTVVTSPSFKLNHAMLQFSVQTAAPYPGTSLPIMHVDVVDAVTLKTLQTASIMVSGKPIPISLSVAPTHNPIQLRFKTPCYSGMYIAVSTIVQSDLPLDYAMRFYPFP